MLVKLLGILDLAAAAILVLSSFDLFPLRWVLMLAAYLILKGIVFRGTAVSTFDIVIGAYLVLLSVGIHIRFIDILLGIYLVSKGAMSLF